MKIVIVSTQFPHPPRSGFTVRVAELARRIAQRHDVTLLSTARPADRPGVAALREDLDVEVVEREPPAAAAKRLAQLASAPSARPYACRAIFSPEMQQAIATLCARGRADVVQLESSLLCAYALPPGPRVVLDEHNIEYEVFERLHEGERSPVRRGFNRLEAARFRRFERHWWARVDGVVVTSEREEPIVRAHAPATPVAVVPNGVDLQRFRPATGDVVPRSVVFNGTLDYRPNLDAALHLAGDIWPRVLERCPDARLEIVGRARPGDARRLQSPGVVVTGEVPDVRPHLARAAVVAVPIRMGGGTRLKVVEALATGKAIVSTSLGCEGIAVRDGEHLRIADDAASFAQRVVELFADRDAAAALGRAGRTLAERAYSWDHAAQRLDALYERVAAGDGPGVAARVA